ncbi:autotransporter outer membrane beta-barrel domain-containing protein [Bartonella tribocorum]|uniref:Autotransporter outer membrane beta-barrel domain-containing protein n=1 Tax=Bartonella tribocorum TaxID=85701 RepID=A0A2M6US34_9HYPH|nr:autotransporter outer membrane beta-barrel domain-containing protein [Bartonella tribocorum]PIT68986.1 autotransporter outer membrane beta-barrel domain-containing protein [Bartonella tribocorum]
MRRNLLLCTAACALFFSSFTFTSTSTASSLSSEARHALEEIVKLPQQYRHAIDLINTPTQAEKNLEKIASGAMMGDNSHFKQALQNSMDNVRDTINSSFAGAGRYGSGAHTEVLAREMDNIRTQAMANQYNQNLQHMMKAKAQLDHLRQNRLIQAANLLRGYDKAVSDAAKAAAILEADNQQRVNTARQQWTTQDNHEWNKLQNKAEILHKAAKMDSALQGQNKELSNTLRKAVLDTLNNDEITNVERKEETSPPPSEKNKHSIIDSNTIQERVSDKLPSADVISQHKENTSLRTDRGITQLGINKNTQSDVKLKANPASSASKTALNPSAEAHLKSPSKIDNTSTTNAKSTSQLTDDKATATSSLDGIENSKTLTPQIENSLVMPIAMFAVGVADVNNQNTLLDNMQITMFEPKDYQERSIFLSTYGNKNTFFSRIHSKQESAQTEQDSIQKKQESVQAEEEGIHANIRADIRYAALQAGATLIARKDQNISTNFGFFGTYGKLFFAPKNAENFHKKMFDKWSLTAYGNIQHDSGIYASAFLSYGIFKENMSKNFIEGSPQINNSKTLGAAATVGQKLSTSFEGVILEPQAQLVYQRLMLGSSSDNNSSSNDSSSSDEDTSKIDISKPDQWLLRIGGRLTQNKGHALSFYGKLNLIKTFSKNFQLAAMGSLVEGGFGIHAYLSQNIELHSDLSYQHKFKKIGISGINVSAGMRYHF